MRPTSEVSSLTDSGAVVREESDDLESVRDEEEREGSGEVWEDRDRHDHGPHVGSKFVVEEDAEEYDESGEGAVGDLIT